MKPLYVILLTTLFFLSASLNAEQSSLKTETPKKCADVKTATFGVDGRYEDYLLACFPCCFCCGDDGDCCDECNDKNDTLVAPQSRDGSTSNTAFSKKNIQQAIREGKIRNIYYKGNTIMPSKGYQFKALTLILPNGAQANRFQLYSDDGDFSNIEVACSCDGLSSNGACAQIGSEPLGITCGGSCDGCEAFVLF